jgi:hypothetical protein
VDNFRGGEREEGDADGAFVNQSGDNFRGGEREEGEADGAFVNQSGDNFRGGITKPLATM